MWISKSTNIRFVFFIYLSTCSVTSIIASTLFAKDFHSTDYPMVHTPLYPQINSVNRFSQYQQIPAPHNEDVPKIMKQLNVELLTDGNTKRIVVKPLNHIKQMGNDVSGHTRREAGNAPEVMGRSTYNSNIRVNQFNEHNNRNRNEDIINSYQSDLNRLNDLKKLSVQIKDHTNGRDTDGHPVKTVVNTTPAYLMYYRGQVNNQLLDKHYGDDYQTLLRDINRDESLKKTNAYQIHEDVDETGNNEVIQSSIPIRSINPYYNVVAPDYTFTGILPFDAVGNHHLLKPNWPIKHLGSSNYHNHWNKPYEISPLEQVKLSRYGRFSRVPFLAKVYGYGYYSYLAANDLHNNQPIGSYKRMKELK